MKTNYYKDNYNCYYDNGNQLVENIRKAISFANRNDVTTISTWLGAGLTVLLLIL